MRRGLNSPAATTRQALRMRRCSHWPPWAWNCHRHRAPAPSVVRVPRTPMDVEKRKADCTRMASANPSAAVAGAGAGAADQPTLRGRLQKSWHRVVQVRLKGLRSESGGRCWLLANGEANRRRNRSDSRRPHPGLDGESRVATSRWRRGEGGETEAD